MCALDRQATRTCIHSVTERDEPFKQKLFEEGMHLYGVVMSENLLDAENDNSL